MKRDSKINTDQKETETIYRNRDMTGNAMDSSPSAFYLFFLKILFIYLTEIETASEGTQAGGVGEEESDSQWRSLMWGSIQGLRNHALSRRQTLND